MNQSEPHAFQTANPLRLTLFSCLHGYQYAGAETNNKSFENIGEEKCENCFCTCSVCKAFERKGGWNKCRPLSMGHIPKKVCIFVLSVTERRENDAQCK